MFQFKQNRKEKSGTGNKSLFLMSNVGRGGKRKRKRKYQTKNKRNQLEEIRFKQPLKIRILPERTSAAAALLLILFLKEPAKDSDEDSL